MSAPERRRRSKPAAPTGLASCPAPQVTGEIELVHGDGGERMAQLIEQVFAARLRDPALDTQHDAALLEWAPDGLLPAEVARSSGTRAQARAAFTTDSFVVRPIEFPGGNIGSLAVFGTVNDLLTRGARPRALAAAFILEEGLALATLERVLDAMREAARSCGVHVVTGDTKVVERGKGDGVYITTSGIGEIPGGLDYGPRSIRPGDAILVSGDIGRHGLAILGARESLGFEPPIESDCASIGPAVAVLAQAGVDVHCLRDATRGGVASAVVEIARASGHAMQLDAAALPVRADVHAASEVLGLDPLYMACEGRALVWVAADAAQRALDCWTALDPGARCIGRVLTLDPLTPQARAPEAVAPGEVVLRTELGTLRPLELATGIALPRIC